MFKKIFRLSIGAITLAPKLLPQALLISIYSEIGTLALEFLVKKLYNKGSNRKKRKLSKKALDQLNKKILFLTEELVKCSHSDFDNQLLEAVKKKTDNI